MRTRNFEPVKSSVEIDAVYEIYNERNEKVVKNIQKMDIILQLRLKGQQ